MSIVTRVLRRRRPRADQPDETLEPAAAAVQSTIAEQAAVGQQPETEGLPEAADGAGMPVQPTPPESPPVSPPTSRPRGEAPAAGVQASPDQTLTAAGLVVPDLMKARLEATPDAFAFNLDGADGLTFREWDARSNAVAHGLIARGAAPGHRVALLFDGMDWTEYAIAYLAVLKAGLTAIHLNTGVQDAEARRRLALCQVIGIVRPTALGSLDDFGGWTADLPDLDTGTTGPVEVVVSPADISDIHFTSGTTGTPKAYQVPHGNLTFGRSAGWFKQFGGAEHMLVPMVLGTGTSATVVNILLTSPVTVVLCDPLSLDRMGRLAESLKIGSLMITPAIALGMIEQRLTERYDLSAVHTLACGSSPLAPATANVLLEMFPGAKISTVCSQSEAGPALIVNTFDPARPLSVGKPSPITELRIAGPDGEPVPAGTVGEIWLRSPAPPRTYLDQPEITARLLADGWHRTGDLGRQDEEGYLYLFDRAVDAIRVGRTLVSSVEVEAAAYTFPGVVECAAFGVRENAESPDQWRVLLVARLQPPATAEGLRDHLGGLLDADQNPVDVVAFDERLPRNQHGKVLKRVLREQYPYFPLSRAE